MNPHISIKNVHKRYENGFLALKGVSMDLNQGKTVALVGESGCGKSTLAKVLLGLEGSSSGEVLINGSPLLSKKVNERAELIQMIFQDPASSLNPRHPVEQILMEPLLIQGKLNHSEIRISVLEILKSVGFDESVLPRYPHMFSGGQRQRLVIARALLLKPQILICDEPVSALDVSVQAQVLNLLKDLQAKFNLTYLFISHDLHVVKWISDHVNIMYLGKIVESGTSKQIFKKPLHPYTQMLLKSTPQLNQPPSDYTRASEIADSRDSGGCSFRSRCKYEVEKCRTVSPPFTQSSTFSEHFVSCWNPLDKTENFQDLNLKL